MLASFVQVRRQPVFSRSLRSVGYEETTGLLEVEFRDDDAVYQYRTVPRKVYDALMRARSKGRFFNEEIRDTYQMIEIRHGRT